MGDRQEGSGERERGESVSRTGSVTDVRVYCQLYGKLKLLTSNILNDFKGSLRLVLKIVLYKGSLE